MSSDPVVEALQVRKDRLPGLAADLETREVNAFTLERSEERLPSRVVRAIAFATHAHRDTRLGKEPLVLVAGVTSILDQHNGVGPLVDGALRRAMRNAISTRDASWCAARAHPTTRREDRSSTAARSSQPSYVQIVVLSPTHFSSGRVAVKSRSKRFGATRALGSLLVVLVR